MMALMRYDAAKLFFTVVSFWQNDIGVKDAKAKRDSDLSTPPKAKLGSCSIGSCNLPKKSSVFLALRHLHVMNIIPHSFVMIEIAKKQNRTEQKPYKREESLDIYRITIYRIDHHLSQRIADSGESTRSGKEKFEGEEETKESRDIEENRNIYIALPPKNSQPF